MVVGGGRLLPYHEEGEICGITFTTVKDLHYDLYSAICAAKRGVSTIIDYEHYERGDGGQNRSYLFDKKTKQATPLIERDGMLEIPFTSFYSARSARHILLASRLVGVAPRHLLMTCFPS